MRLNVSQVLGILTLASFIATTDSLANPAEAARLRREVAEVNRLLMEELRIPTRRCTNNFIRIERIKQILAAFNPQMNRLIGERAGLEADLAKTQSDLAGFQKELAGILATIEGLRRKLDEFPHTMERQVASINAKIDRATRERQAASDMLDGRQEAYDNFLAANEEALDAIARSLLEPNASLTPAQQALIGRKTGLGEEVDLLEEQIQTYTAQIEQFNRDRRALLGGDRTGLSELRRALNEQLAKRDETRQKISRARTTRDSLNEQIARKTAEIARLTQVQVPEIHPACKKLFPNR